MPDSSSSQQQLQLIETLLNQQQLEEAGRKCRQLTETESDNHAPWLLLARIQLRSGQPREALQSCQEAQLCQHGNLTAYYLAGLSFKALGDHANAIRAFHYCSEDAEVGFQARIQLAAIYAQIGNHRQAIEHYQSALATNADNASVQCNLGYSYHAIGEYAQAIQHYHKALAIEPELEQAHINIAFSHEASGDYDEALRWYRKTSGIKPGSVNALTGEASILYRAGHEDTAIDLVEPLLDKHRDYVPLVTLYAQMSKKHRHFDNALSYVTNALELPGISVTDRIQLGFAAGSLYDTLKNYAQAYRHYSEGNALVKSDYSAEQHSKRIDQTLDYFTTEKFRSLPRTQLKTRKPIFIIGMPRSGTSLTEQILASHTDVYTAGELQTIHRLSNSIQDLVPGHVDDYPAYLDALTEGHFTQLSSTFLDSLAELSCNSRYVTDKTPHNFLYLPLINLLFPDAYVIHCKRHPLDTCLSCYFRLFSGGNDFSYNLDDLGMHYRDYDRLMQHWKTLPGIRMFDIRYEDLVEKTEQAARKLLDYCGLEWTDECLRFHQTRRENPSASFDQVNKPIYRDSMHRWQNYENDIGMLKELLADIIDEYERTPD